MYCEKLWGNWSRELHPRVPRDTPPKSQLHPTFGRWRGSSSETGQAPACQQAFRLLAQLGAEAGEGNGEKR